MTTACRARAASVSATTTSGAMAVVPTRLLAAGQDSWACWSRARLYMLQVITFVIGAGAPWLGNALYVLRLSPWRGLDLTPFAFTVTAVAVTIGVMWFHFLDIVPIARDSVIESMTDGVIVLDEQNRIADINTAGLLALGMTANMVIGQPVAQVTARWPQVVARYHGAIDVSE